MRHEQKIWSIIVKAPTVTVARAHAKARLGEDAIVRGRHKQVTSYEVRLLVQCPIEDLQEWFAEDLDDTPPYAMGSLLLWSPWTKFVGHQLNAAKHGERIGRNDYV